MNEKTAQKILEKVTQDFDTISNDFDKTRKSDWEEFHQFLNYIKDSDFLVDLGCGNGRFYNFIKKYRKIKYLGIDNSEKLLNHAQKQFKDAKFLKANILELPLENGKTDIAAAIATLHHIPSKKFRKQTITEISRILKKNGYAIITVWNLFQPKYKKYIWQARLRHILSLGRYDSRDTFIPWAKTGIKRYYYAFTPKELRKLLEKSGFTIISEHISRNITFICKKS